MNRKVFPHQPALSVKFFITYHLTVQNYEKKTRSFIPAWG